MDTACGSDRINSFSRLVEQVYVITAVGQVTGHGLAAVTGAHYGEARVATQVYHLQGLLLAPSASRRTNCWVEKICWVSGPCNYTVKTPGGSKRRPGGVVVQQLFQAQGQGLALLDHLTELQQVYFQLLVDITRLLEARGALATRYTATRPPGAAGGVAGR